MAPFIPIIWSLSILIQSGHHELATLAAVAELCQCLRISHGISAHKLARVILRCSSRFALLLVIMLVQRASDYLVDDGVIFCFVLIHHKALTFRFVIQRGKSRTYRSVV